MTITAFDLDNTLLNGDSDRSWRLFLVEEGLLNADEERESSAKFLRDYEGGVLDAAACTRFAIAPVAGLELTRLQQLEESFCQRHIAPMIEQPALELLDKHRAQGDKLVIITSTNRYIAQGAVGMLGLQPKSQLLATELEWRDGRLTGDISGTPCYQSGKITHLTQWAKPLKESLKEAYFYSDSSNDLPLLQAVGHPVAVNPDANLRAVAAKSEWPVLDLFDTP